MASVSIGLNLFKNLIATMLPFFLNAYYFLKIILNFKEWDYHSRPSYEPKAAEVALNEYIETIE